MTPHEQHNPEYNPAVTDEATVEQPCAIPDEARVILHSERFFKPTEPGDNKHHVSDVPPSSN